MTDSSEKTQHTSDENVFYRCCREHKKQAGECRSCKKCLDCCGHDYVKGSCQWNIQRESYAKKIRSERGLDGYWKSVEAGRQKR